MYRYLSSIRHSPRSSLLSLFTPKHSLHSSSSSPALASRYLPLTPQNRNEHVRGFSTGDRDPNPFSILGRGNLRSENDGNETLGKQFNTDSFPSASQDMGTINSKTEKVPDFLKKYLEPDPSPSDAWDSESYGENDRSANRGSGPVPSLMRSSGNGAGDVRGTNPGTETLPFFKRGSEDGARDERGNNSAALSSFITRLRDNMSAISENDSSEKSYKPMDFVRGVIEDGERLMGSPFSGPRLEMDADFVHIKMLRNNTFVTVTDSKGNIKLSGSAGSLKEMKSGQKLSRYAAEATAEVVGRRARGLGLKAVVMKVNGFTHFRRKRQAIMSWLEGFNVSRGDRHRNPVVYIEDTTRKPHNGCRLPKKRRI